MTVWKWNSVESEIQNSKVPGSGWGIVRREWLILLLLDFANSDALGSRVRSNGYPVYNVDLEKFRILLVNEWHAASETYECSKWFFGWNIFTCAAICRLHRKGHWSNEVVMSASSLDWTVSAYLSRDDRNRNGRLTSNRNRGFSLQSNWIKYHLLKIGDAFKRLSVWRNNHSDRQFQHPQDHQRWVLTNLNAHEGDVRRHRR